MIPHLIERWGGSFAFLGSLGPAELRAAAAALTAFLAVLAAGGPFIRHLRRKQILERTMKGDSDRLDALHASKSATPTLGGIVLFGGVYASAALWTDLRERLVVLILAYTLGLALVGFLDDSRKLRTRKGLKARTKLRAQLALSLLAGAYLCAFPIDARLGVEQASAGTSLFLPFWKEWLVDLGPLFALLVVCVATGASNAVNLTDGLDGLAAGTSLLAGAALAVTALLAGHEGSSSLLHIPYVPAALEVGVFLGALLGGGLGFLWWNAHPAQIFMGDTGALPLGGALGLTAVIIKQELLLLVAGGVLVAEALSVILQVASFKLRKKRIFLIAPLHHHYQFKGWAETKITMRFWIAGAILAAFALVTLGS